MNRSSLVTATLAAAVGALLATAAAPAVAGPGAQRPRPAVQQHRPHPGAEFTRESVRTRTDNGFTRNTTITNGQGQVATRDLTVSRDRDAGTITRSMDATGFDGRQRSADTVITRTADGHTVHTTATGPNGTATRDVSVVRDPANGTVTRTVTRSRDGN